MNKQREKLFSNLVVEVKRTEWNRFAVLAKRLKLTWNTGKSYADPMANPFSQLDVDSIWIYPKSGVWDDINRKQQKTWKVRKVISVDEFESRFLPSEEVCRLRAEIKMLRHQLEEERFSKLALMSIIDSIIEQPED